jgi:hypothetical protein
MPSQTISQQYLIPAFCLFFHPYRGGTTIGRGEETSKGEGFSSFPSATLGVVSEVYDGLSIYKIKNVVILYAA